MINNTFLLFFHWLLFLTTAISFTSAKQPLIIAHRGSAGEYPGLTMPAFEQAVKDGADMIELDTAVTKDGQILCLHEPELSLTTNIVAISNDSKSPFYHKNTTDTVTEEGGKSYTKNDWWVTDFTLIELNNLLKFQRFRQRNNKYDLKFNMPTLESVIQNVVLKYNIKVLIEVKLCQYYTKKTSLSTEDLVVNLLKKLNVFHRRDLIYLQTFEETCAQNLKLKAPSLEVHQLYSKSDISEDKMRIWVSRGLSGIGVHKALIATGSAYPPESPLFSNKYDVNGTSDVVNTAHSLGLAVNVWTLRNEDQYMPHTFLQDAYKEIEFYMQAKVDGIITDFPKTAKSAINCLTNSSSSVSPANYYYYTISILCALFIIIAYF